MKRARVWPGLEIAMMLGGQSDDLGKQLGRISGEKGRFSFAQNYPG